MITQEISLALFNYDTDTGVMTWKVNAYSSKAGAEIGTKTGRRGLSYRSVKVLGRSYMVHRLVWLHMYGEMPDKYIDHINGNGLDNRLSNLRLATPEENQRNQKLRIDNKSGFKGVWYDKSRCKYQAYINHEGKRLHLGRYDTPDEAYREYCNAADRLHKEFANYG